MYKIRKTQVFSDWFDGLRDDQARARVAFRLDRLAGGNAGDTRPVGEGVSELRIHYGPGYRVYYKKQGNVVIVVLAGGSKKSQSRDIQSALDLARKL